MTHTDDHELVRGDDEDVLSACASHVVRVLRQVPVAFTIDPEKAAVHGTLPRGSRRADELRPAFGEDSSALPYAVLEIEQPEARPVARRSVVVPRQQEVAVRIRLEHLPPDADAIEERTLRP